MENKKLGVLLIVLSLFIGGTLLYYNSQLVRQSQEVGCFESPDCLPIEESLSLTHFAFGIFSFVLALGFYLLFFNKTEQIILKKLEDEKNNKIKDEKFDIILKVLDEYESRVLKAIKDQEGITQSTLRLRTDMSKAKLSYVLQDLEKRNLIKRVPKGKTLQIYLRI